MGLKRLTIQLVFNEVSQFTFSKETHGFDITVPKNYLKIDIFQIKISNEINFFLIIVFILIHFKSAHLFLQEFL